VRAAKGHDVAAAELSYRDGDRLLQAIHARSTQQIAFLDSSGRSFSTLAHTLPSARGNGEPLTGRFTLTPGVQFQTLIGGELDTRVVLASSYGYGFVTRFENLTGRQKAGKSMITLPDGARVLAPTQVHDVASDRLAVITTAGHLLVFGVAELPELDRGKGNKLIEIPRSKLGTERVAGIAAIPLNGALFVHSGQRTPMRLAWKDLDDYLGARASRGGLLPRGWQRVDGLSVE